MAEGGLKSEMGKIVVKWNLAVHQILSDLRFPWIGQHLPCVSHRNTARTGMASFFHSWKVKYLRIFTGWWFGTFFTFPYIWNNHPNWLIFFQRVSNHQPVQHVLMERPGLAQKQWSNKAWGGQVRWKPTVEIPWGHSLVVLRQWNPLAPILELMHEFMNRIDHHIGGFIDNSWGILCLFERWQCVAFAFIFCFSSSREGKSCSKPCTLDSC